MPEYDPNLDEVIVEEHVPNYDLIVQVVRYNGGEKKLTIRRVVDSKKLDRVIFVDPKRMPLDEFDALLPVLVRVRKQA
jgi:hypothetical protein